jgi:DNA-binding XRE family transcriptional regulator
MAHGCPKCGSKMQLKVGAHDVGRLVGLPSVTIRNLRAHVCPRRHEVIINGKVLQRILLCLARLFVTQVDRLGGCEVRYLRKYLRETQGQFAERLGVSRATAARWEEDPMKEVDSITSYAIRSAVAAALREQKGVKLDLESRAERRGYQRPAHLGLAHYDVPLKRGAA